MKFKGIALVTGVGMSPAQKVFSNQNPATIVRGNDGCFKMNAAAGTAVVLANTGWLVFMTGYEEAKLRLLADTLLPVPHHYREARLTDKTVALDIARQVKMLKQETGLPVHLVHYGGASDTKTPLPGNSVFGNPWEIPGAAIPDLVANNCTTLLNMLQALKEEGAIADQEVTKLIFITAITALRTKLHHALDASQKGAGHALARSLALDLTPEKIYVTEVMPGITDTGFYDNETTFSVLVRSSEALGYPYTPENLPVLRGENVGEMVRFALEFPGHIREISGMPYGQYPHLGA